MSSTEIAIDLSGYGFSIVPSVVVTVQGTASTNATTSDVKSTGFNLRSTATGVNVSWVAIGNKV